MKQQPFEPNRRLFLRRVTFGSGAAGLLLGAGLGLPGQAGAKQQLAPAAGEGESSQGYHMTEHIREYYRKAAF